jgi:hypothetical protein
MKTITIVIDKVGQVAVQTHGFDGQSCKDATKAIEVGLGVVLSDRPSFDQPTLTTSAEVKQ